MNELIVSKLDFNGGDKFPKDTNLFDPILGIAQEFQRLTDNSDGWHKAEISYCIQDGEVRFIDDVRIVRFGDSLPEPPK